MTEISFDAADYPAIRHALIDLHQRIIKNPNPFDVKTCARHLGLLHKKTLTFRNDTEVDLLTDYMVYAFRPNDFNMAEKYLRLNKSRLNEYDQALLNAVEVLNALEHVDDNNFVAYFLNPANGSTLARAIVSASIRLGNTENVGYHEV